MILLIDHYESFTYNLVQYIGALEPDIRVVRNDVCTLAEIEEMHPQAIVISPGPGKPSDAGICIEAIRYFKDKVPILGVCLGHQAIGEVFGGKIVHARELVHGKQSMIEIDKNSRLFEGLPQTILAARYHSLIIDKYSKPECLEVIATTNDGEIMAVKHCDYDIYGVQFHPESIMTPDGLSILKNFLAI